MTNDDTTPSWMTDIWLELMAGDPWDTIKGTSCDLAKEILRLRSELARVTNELKRSERNYEDCRDLLVIERRIFASQQSPK